MPEIPTTNTQYHRLVDLLIERGARCLWSVRGPAMHVRGQGNLPSVLEAWDIAHLGGVIIVHGYSDEGVAVYTDNGATCPDDFSKIAEWLGPTLDERRAAARATLAAVPLHGPVVLTPDGPSVALEAELAGIPDGRV